MNQTPTLIIKLISSGQTLRGVVVERMAELLQSGSISFSSWHDETRDYLCSTGGMLTRPLLNWACNETITQHSSQKEGP